MSDCPFVSRGGLKLAAALEAFGLDPSGQVWADFGCNVGGFTDCLLQRGARRVYALDTGYGELAWTLRRDDRVVVMERTNALHAEPPEPVDAVAADMAWTTQDRIAPAAAAWLKPGGVLVSLMKPHYELAHLDRRKPRGPLTEDDRRRALVAVCRTLAGLGFAVEGVIDSPIAGKGGNVEMLLRIRPGGQG